MPALLSNECALEYTTFLGDNDFTITITKLYKFDNFKIDKYRTISIKVGNKKVIAVTARQTPTVKQILSSVNHNGKVTNNQRRDAENMHAAQLNSNQTEAWNRALSEFNNKKNNNQLRFVYQRGVTEKEVAIYFSVFGAPAQVVLKVAKKEDSGQTPTTHEETKTIGIENVNEGKNYVINEDAYAKYGHIERVVDFSDVEDENQLLALSKIYVNNLQFDDVSIEVSAVDLHHLTGSTPSFELLDEVRCISRPHGLNRTFPITEINIPLDNPSGVTYKMGRSGSSTMSQSTAANAVDLFKRINSMPSPNKVLDTAKVEMSELLNNRTTGFVNIVQENDISQALVISNAADWTQATKLWKFDVNGLGYSDSTVSDLGRYDNATTINADGRLYKIGMTMDGTIVADFIKTGLLEDGLGYNYWNLSTGEFRLSPNTLLDVDNLDNSIATIGDLAAQVEDVKDDAEIAASKEYNASNILRKSDDFSVLNEFGKSWEDGNWSTTTTKPNSPSLCKIEIVDSYSNPVNADVPATGVSKAVAFIHARSYSSPTSLQTEIRQNGIKVATKTVYTLACYACGQGRLDFRVGGTTNKNHTIYLDHSSWKRYNLVFKVEDSSFDISGERYRLNGLKQNAISNANNYKTYYENLKREKAPSANIKAAKKNYSDAQKEVKKYESQIAELDLVIKRTTSETISVYFQHSGLGVACIAGLTLIKGNVSKDWQPSDDDFFSIKTSIEEKLNMQYLMDKLTDGGKKQGVYMQNGTLLINAEYIMAGLLTDKHRFNTWDLENGRLKTTNMVATNIQANGVLQSMDIWGYRTPTQPLGSLVRISNGEINWYFADHGKERHYARLHTSNVGGLYVDAGLFIKQGLTTRPTYRKYGKVQYGQRVPVKTWYGKYLPGLSRIIRIKGVTYNKKKKLTHTILAELTFTNGILTGSKIYDKNSGKLAAGGKPVSNNAYVLQEDK